MTSRNGDRDHAFVASTLRRIMLARLDVLGETAVLLTGYVDATREENG